MLNYFDALVVIGQVRSEAFQTNYVQCLGCLEGAMQMKVLSWSLGLIEICRQPAVENRLGLKKVGVCLGQVTDMSVWIVNAYP